MSNIEQETSFSHDPLTAEELGRCLNTINNLKYPDKERLTIYVRDRFCLYAPNFEILRGIKQGLITRDNLSNTLKWRE